MKIEVQIGCEFGYADIVRSVLENMDASTQLVVPMSSAVTMHDAKSFNHQIEELYGAYDWWNEQMIGAWVFTQWGPTN